MGKNPNDTVRHATFTNGTPEAGNNFVGSSYVCTHLHSNKSLKCLSETLLFNAANSLGRFCSASHLSESGKPGFWGGCLKNTYVAFGWSFYKSVAGIYKKYPPGAALHKYRELILRKFDTLHW